MIDRVLHLFYGRAHWKARGTLAEMGGVTISTGRMGAGVSRLAAGDLDGDGLAELVATATGAGGTAGIPAARAWITRLYDPVTIDVRPDVQPNVIVYPGGTLAVRLSGARQGSDEIDPATLRAAGAAVTDYVWRDFDQDGRNELQVYFDTRTMRLDTSTRTLVMTGRTRGGRPLAGIDTVVVYDAADGPRPAAVTGRPRASARR